MHCFFVAHLALADTHTWTDASPANSNWSEPGNWSPAGPPAFDDDAIITPGLLGTAGPAVVSLNASLANLQVAETLGGEGEVRILASRDLVINAGDVLNDGLIVVNSDGGTQASRLRFSAFAGDNLHTLSGNGVILLQAGSQTFPTTVSPATIETISSVVTQNAGHTIRGVGRVTASIVNNGNILAADLPAAPGANVLEISGSGGMTNNATLGTEANATLDIVGTYSITQGANGVISAANGGTVNLRNFVHINGGTLQTKGSGIVITSSAPAGQFATRLTDATNEGTYQVNGGGAVTIAGNGFTNDGIVNLNGFMSYLNSGVLTGTGELVLAGAAVVDTQAGVTLGHAAGHTIRGSGQINAQVTNEGVISATGTLRLVGDATTNNHELRAVSGGTLQVENFVTQDPTTGLIVADNGGTVKLMSSGRVIEGRLQTVGTGIIQAGDGTRLIDVVNEGTIHVRPISSGGQLLIEGSGIANDGTIVVNPLSQGGTYRMTFCCDPQMTLDGTGVVDLNHTNSNLTVAAGTVLNNVAGHTIEGRGQINGEIVNEGSILGDASHLPIQINGKLTGTGTLQNIRFEGTHAPGNNGPEHQVVTGLYAMNPGAKLEIEIGGPTYATDIDWVDVLGSITLGGTLEVELIGGYVPTGPAGFPIVTSTGGRTGVFANEILPELPGGFFFELEYTAFSVNLAVMGIAGDYNKNGIVDAADYVVWRKMFRQTGSGLAADGNADGSIDSDDYDVWRAAFGQIAPGAGSGLGISPSQVHVPEPTAILLAGMAASGLVFRRPRIAR
ncbi:MAG: hypothetical protein WD738_19295 [Pirellulales bacterium]